MAFCKNCGAQIQDDAKFCPGCGKAIDNAAAPPQEQSQAQSGYTPPVVPGAPTQAEFIDAHSNKGMAILSYIIFFIPLLTGDYKKSPFVKFHANQGTVLFIASAIFGVAYSIILAIFSTVFLTVFHAWILWGAISMVFSCLWLLPTILCILGIVNAANGKMQPLPLIGKFTIIK